MKVYVVNVTSWSGSDEVTSVYCVKNSMENAIAFCDSMNANRNSSYTPYYDYEEFEVEDS